MYLAVDDDYYAGVDLNVVLDELSTLLQTDRQQLLQSIEQFIVTWNHVMGRLTRHHAEYTRLNSFLLCTLLMLARKLMHNPKFLAAVDCIFRLERGSQPRSTKSLNYKLTAQPNRTPSGESLLTAHKGRALVLLDCMLMTLHTMYVVDFVNLIQYQHLLQHNHSYGLASKHEAHCCSVFVEHVIMQIVKFANSTIYRPLYDSGFVRALLPPSVYAQRVVAPVMPKGPRRVRRKKVTLPST